MRKGRKGASGKVKYSGKRKREKLCGSDRGKQIAEPVPNRIASRKEQRAERAEQGRSNRIKSSQVKRNLVWENCEQKAEPFFCSFVPNIRIIRVLYVDVFV